MNVRAHPTVRPFALALGVFPRAAAADDLSFLGPVAAQEMASALLLDTLGALSTFPVRHRVVFTKGSDAVTHAAKLPATWREVPQRGDTGPQHICSAFDDLLGLGAEAVLLLSADSPVMPLGPLFDGLMWLLPKTRFVVGPIETGGAFALGSAEPCAWVGEVPGSPFGLVGEEPLVLDAPSATAEAKSRGLEVLELAPAYRVDSKATLKQLYADVQKGAFAPACRKLFERADIRVHAE